MIILLRGPIFGQSKWYTKKENGKEFQLLFRNCKADCVYL